jgi:hypothetical protein
MSTFGNVAEYNINIQKSGAFLFTNNEQAEKKKSGKQFHLQ